MCIRDRIYDSPVSHKYGMLKPALMRRYNHLFDLAEKAVAAEPDFLKRVQRARLPIQYSEPVSYTHLMGEICKFTETTYGHSYSFCRS